MNEKVTLTFELTASADGELSQMSKLLIAVETFAAKLAEDDIAALISYRFPALVAEDESKRDTDNGGK